VGIGFDLLLDAVWNGIAVFEFTHQQQAQFGPSLPQLPKGSH